MACLSIRVGPDRSFTRRAVCLTGAEAATAPTAGSLSIDGERDLVAGRR